MLCFPLDVQRLSQLAKVPRVPGDVSDADNADDDVGDEFGGGDIYIMMKCLCVTKNDHFIKRPVCQP